MNYSTPGFPVLQHLLKLMSIELVMPSNHLILCHPPSPPALNLFPASGSFPVSHSSHQMVKVLQPCILGNKLTQKDNADSGVQFITPEGAR